MFERFRGVLESPHFSGVRDEEKRKEYTDLTSGRKPLFFYESDELTVEVYQRASQDDPDHSFRSADSYLVRYESEPHQYTGFLVGDRDAVSMMDGVLVEELDRDEVYKKIVRSP